MRIAVVDDNPVNRLNFQQKVKQFEDLELILIANDGHDFLEQLKGLPFADHPEIVFMDIQMPGLNGIDTIKLAKALYPEIHFIILTVFEDDENIFEAIRAGASGYLLKHENYLSIRQAISEVFEFGGAPMSPAIARKTLQILGNRNLHSEPDTSLLEHLLTDREMEILQHLVNGYDAKRIAEITAISILTVRKHIANVYTKLHVNSKAQVISMAHKNKWVN
jgi:DNA-binding NarL/FixJ family response regulator